MFLSYFSCLTHYAILDLTVHRLLPCNVTPEQHHFYMRIPSGVGRWREFACRASIARSRMGKRARKPLRTRRSRHDSNFLAHFRVRTLNLSWEKCGATCSETMKLSKLFSLDYHLYLSVYYTWALGLDVKWKCNVKRLRTVCMVWQIWLELYGYS